MAIIVITFSSSLRHSSYYRLTNKSRHLARAPYSVLKLIARHCHSTVKQTSPPPAMQNKKSSSLRQNLFDQEVQAESQARTEMTEYLDSLVESGDCGDWYDCVWPLEEYRRAGWSHEMVATYPSECADFVGKVTEQLEKLNRRERGEMNGLPV